MRFLLAGGGSGGHLYPGLALAEALRADLPGAEIRFVGARGGLEERIVPAEGYGLDLLAVGRGSPLSARRPGNLPRFAAAVARSLSLLRSFAPAAVVALGGYAAAAPGLAARLRGVPLFALEQNTIPGRTTRMLCRWARGVYLQFAEAGPRLRCRPERVHVTGSPLGASIAALAAGEPCRGDGVLVVGGSQGARRLDEIAAAALPRVMRETGCAVRHIAWAGHRDAIAEAYAKAGVEAEVMTYCRRMETLYAASRLVVARAGATTLAELAAAGLPAVLVPYPHARDDHQAENARVVAAAGGARVFAEETLAPFLLAQTVMELWKDESRRRAMAEAMRAFARPDAAGHVAAAIRDAIGSGR